MSEIEQLKQRIDQSLYDGIATSIIRDDYEPIGQMMINDLVQTGEYVTLRVKKHDHFSIDLNTHGDQCSVNVNTHWKIFNKRTTPYQSEY